MQREMLSPAVDEHARRELGTEWDRHRAAMHGIVAGERDRFLAELHRHLDRVQEIMQGMQRRALDVDVLQAV